MSSSEYGLLSFMSRLSKLEVFDLRSCRNLRLTPLKIGLVVCFLLADILSWWGIDIPHSGRGLLLES